ncbi:MAG: formate/nitrite transporter family protein [Cryomorphaceae bacterium]|nr:formate/nitrite transporter family protein [Flavobacteriales bacterium]
MSEEQKPKEHSDVLREQLVEGLKESDQSNTRLFLSAFTAGLEIGFSILIMGVLYTVLNPHYDENVLHLIVSLGYPLGFIFVIIGRSQLFTEQTALAMVPMLNGNTTLSQLLRLWLVVFIGNIIGGVLFSILITWIGPARGIIELDTFSHLAGALIEPEWHVILGSAILAGWMMGLLGWLVTTSQETVSRIFIVILITAIIGAAKLHHCIVGSVELFCGLLIGSVSPAEYGMVMVFAVLGNIIGGAIFVGALKFSVANS